MCGDEVLQQQSRLGDVLHLQVAGRREVTAPLSVQRDAISFPAKADHRPEHLGEGAARPLALVKALVGSAKAGQDVLAKLQAIQEEAQGFPLRVEADADGVASVEMLAIHPLVPAVVGRAIRHEAPSLPEREPRQVVPSARPGIAHGTDRSLLRHAEEDGAQLRLLDLQLPVVDPRAPAHVAIRQAPAVVAPSRARIQPRGGHDDARMRRLGAEPERMLLGQVKVTVHRNVPPVKHGGHAEVPMELARVVAVARERTEVRVRLGAFSVGTASVGASGIDRVRRPRLPRHAAEARSPPRVAIARHEVRLPEDETAIRVLAARNRDHRAIVWQLDEAFIARRLVRLGGRLGPSKPQDDTIRERRTKPGPDCRSACSLRARQSLGGAGRRPGVHGHDVEGTVRTEAISALGAVRPPHLPATSGDTVPITDLCDLTDNRIFSRHQLSLHAGARLIFCTGGLDLISIPDGAACTCALLIAVVPALLRHIPIRLAGAVVPAACVTPVLVPMPPMRTSHGLATDFAQGRLVAVVSISAPRRRDWTSRPVNLCGALGTASDAGGSVQVCDLREGKGCLRCTSRPDLPAAVGNQEALIEGIDRILVMIG
mmetsp:Transcript_1139/g.4813  ORF Transcript_1139/g.4813 Transcript_1139/m.4813 type:complete len:600 (+) Transcript_1139:5549-7348(+)|eukprot:scaffold980_cov248-Pinguiococcus_pyrenoidosus.AAC.3